MLIPLTKHCEDCDDGLAWSYCDDPRGRPIGPCETCDGTELVPLRCSGCDAEAICLIDRVPACCVCAAEWAREAEDVEEMA